jgi:anaerobic magnesium-protoporphyrin IX monomethyl ester cyclase
LKVKALMSCGHPGESEETIGDIRDWLIRSKVDDFDCTVITTYPGTPYYDLAVPHASESGVWTYTQPKTGDRLHSREVDYTVCADYYKGDPNGGYRSFVFTDHLTGEQIVQLRDAVERDVRAALNIPFNPGAAALRYEHSMGQGLPDFIHRTGKPPAEAPAAPAGLLHAS